VIAATSADAVLTFLSHPDEFVASPVACILLDCRLIKSHPFAVPAFDQRLDLCKGKRRVSACLLQPKAIAVPTDAKLMHRRASGW
jgi:hypothetical protein